MNAKMLTPTAFFLICAAAFLAGCETLDQVSKLGTSAAVAVGLTGSPRLPGERAPPTGRAGHLGRCIVKRNHFRSFAMLIGLLACAGSCYAFLRVWEQPADAYATRVIVERLNGAADGTGEAAAKGLLPPNPAAFKVAAKPAAGTELLPSIPGTDPLLLPGETPPLLAARPRLWRWSRCRTRRRGILAL